MESQLEVNIGPLEDAAYFPVPGAHLYTVVHRVANPAARVLLIGPFASERHYSYIPWVGWARYLAARGIECLRYDYRGIGESTGVFEEMSFEHWLEDVELLAAWLKSQSPDVPLLLHGLELGAVLAACTFDAGVGDALMLWAPPAGANASLRSTLLRRISMDNAFKFGDERKPTSSYLSQLEEGGLLEVEGYRWTARLWRDSYRYQIPTGLDEENNAGSYGERPVRSVKLDKQAVPLVKGTSVGYEGVGKDFSDLFADNLKWVNSAVVIGRGGLSGPSH